MIGSICQYLITTTPTTTTVTKLQNTTKAGTNKSTNTSSNVSQLFISNTTKISNVTTKNSNNNYTTVKFLTLNSTLSKTSKITTTNTTKQTTSKISTLSITSKTSPINSINAQNNVLTVTRNTKEIGVETTSVISLDTIIYYSTKYSSSITNKNELEMSKNTIITSSSGANGDMISKNDPTETNTDKYTLSSTDNDLNKNISGNLNSTLYVTPRYIATTTPTPEKLSMNLTSSPLESNHLKLSSAKTERLNQEQATFSSSPPNNSVLLSTLATSTFESHESKDTNSISTRDDSNNINSSSGNTENLYQEKTSSLSSSTKYLVLSSTLIKSNVSIPENVSVNSKSYPTELSSSTTETLNQEIKFNSNSSINITSKLSVVSSTTLNARTMLPTESEDNNSISTSKHSNNIDSSTLNTEIVNQDKTGDLSSSTSSSSNYSIFSSSWTSSTLTTLLEDSNNIKSRTTTPNSFYVNQLSTSITMKDISKLFTNAVTVTPFFTKLGPTTTVTSPFWDNNNQALVNRTLIYINHIITSTISVFSKNVLLRLNLTSYFTSTVSHSKLPLCKYKTV